MPETPHPPRTIRSTPFSGNGVCRWCGTTDLPPRRRSWCSDACVHEYKIRSDMGYVRIKVRERDKGVCAECGFDTDGARARLRHLWLASCDGDRAGQPAARVRALRRKVGAARAAAILDRLSRIASYSHRRFAEELRRAGHRPSMSKSWWEADHIVPVAEGGGQCGLDGFRTLCIPCHLKATAALRTRLAARRKAAESP